MVLIVDRISLISAFISNLDKSLISVNFLLDHPRVHNVQGYYGYFFVHFH